mmetsp:Transcript_45902/g.132412  ORF Transcript_45902/g.132412 Transcript_45902/m.132412 type:complete len:95 (-) Transcript_45902:58-342(-)
MQNPEEVIVKLPIANSVVKGDVQLLVKPDRLRLAVAGKPICDRALAKEVDPEEVSWMFETDGGCRELVVTLPKVNRTALKKARDWPCLWADEDV